MPLYLENILTPRMLAVWYMDDGNYTGNSCTFNTHSLSMDEQRRVRKIFEVRLGISSTLVKDRHQYKITIGKTGVDKLMRVIEPHIIYTMAYKIAYPRNDLLEKSRAGAPEASAL